MSSQKPGPMRRPRAAWLRASVSFRVATAYIVGIVTLVSCVAVPFKVTVDGILYLSSAKSLFKSAFATDYAWFREPGYPVMLRMIHFLGNDATYITIAQAICLGLASAIALYAVRRVLGHSNVTVGGLVLVLVLTLNPMYVIYSALVLQQALFAFQLALFGLGVVWAMHRPAWLARWMLLILVALNYFTAVWTSIGWIYLGLVPVVLTVVLAYFPIASALYRKVVTRARKVVTVAITVAAIVAVCGVVYGAGLQVYSGWQAVKAPHLHDLTIPAAVIEPLSSAPHIPTPVVMTKRMFAIMHMGTIALYTHENDLFLRQQMLPGRALGLWDTKYVDKPYTTYAAGWISLPNPSNEVHTVYAWTATMAPFAYSATFVGFLLAIVLAFVRRKWKLLLVLAVPLSFIAVYAASNSPIDRYGIPAYPWAVAAVGVLVTWLDDLIRRVRKRKPVPE